MTQNVSVHISWCFFLGMVVVVVVVDEISSLPCSPLRIKMQPGFKVEVNSDLFIGPSKSKLDTVVTRVMVEPHLHIPSAWGYEWSESALGFLSVLWMNEYGDFGFFDKISGYQDSHHLTEKLRFIQSLSE